MCPNRGHDHYAINIMFVSNVFLVILISTSDYCSANRVKRIVNGWRIVGRDGPYDVIRYVVAFGTEHGTSWKTLGFFLPFLKEKGLYGVISCGGSLLTPTVVQTACHCLSNFYANPRGDKKLPRVLHGWEGEAVVYIGVNDRFGREFSMMTVPPVSSELFVVHQKCEIILDPPYHDVFYDFGFIRISPEWTSGRTGVPTPLVTFAPLYTLEELTRNYNAFQQTQNVCLAVGWGSTRQGGYIGGDYIKGGWMRMMSRQDCIKYTCETPYALTDFTHRDIEQCMSWVCAEKFPKFDQGHAKGDSGSPVTCSNIYIGFVQGTKPLKDRTYIIEEKNIRVKIEAAIYHTPYENSANYRRAFDRTLREYRGSSYAVIVQRLARMYSDEFVEHVGEEAIERVMATEKGIVPITRMKHIHKNSTSVMLKSTSIARLLSQEMNDVQSFSLTSHDSFVLPVFSLIALLPFNL